MNASEISDFFWRNKGRCFEGWSTKKLHDYVLVNVVRRNVFYALDGAKIGLAAIVWPEYARMIRALDAAGEPQFSWTICPHKGDSLLIADVAGQRALMPEIFKQVQERWPDCRRQRLFTYRRGALVELTWETATRFIYGKLS